MRIVHDDRLVGKTLTRAARQPVHTGTHTRVLLFAVVWALLLIAARVADLSAQTDAQAGPATFTIPPLAPVVRNWDFECDLGYAATSNDLGETVFLADGWSLARATGGPIIHSARIFFENRARTGAGCDSDTQFIERLHGRDSLVIRSRDIETPPEPGKPFDVVFYQRFPATIGGAYSASGWFVSLCGGSASPNDCPDGYYIAKYIGIDPYGGTDPDSPDIVWNESRAPHVLPNGERVGWTNLSVAAIAQSQRITLFGRVHSPFRWHGNFAYVDAINLVRAPVAQFLPLPAAVTDSHQLLLEWESLQSPDVVLIPGGTYQLLYDIQMRRPPRGDWRDVAVGLVGTSSHTVNVPCVGVYEFRIRARAEQPPAPPDGASPNQRYPGVWSVPVSVRFMAAPVSGGSDFTGGNTIFLPAISRNPGC